MKEVQGILKHIREGKLEPVYILEGEEPYYIDLLSAAFEHQVLQEHERDFNLSVFYGKDSSWADIVNAARSYPVFAERRLVILKEAAQLKDFKRLYDYLENPAPQTILVIAYKYGKTDGRARAIKKWADAGTVLRSELIRDYQVADWIAQYCREKSIKIQAATTELLATYLGNDLQKIVNELDKVLLNLSAGAEITPELVQQYIGISKEYNVFALQEALIQCDAERCYRVVNYFVANPKEAPLVNVSINLYQEFNRLYQTWFLLQKSDAELAGQLKLSPFIAKKYRQYTRNYSLAQCEKALMEIHHLNMQAVGMHTVRADMSILREFTAKILSL